MISILKHFDECTKLLYVAYLLITQVVNKQKYLLFIVKHKTNKTSDNEASKTFTKQSSKFCFHKHFFSCSSFASSQL
jgi:hypothetical protein